MKVPVRKLNQSETMFLVNPFQIHYQMHQLTKYDYEVLKFADVPKQNSAWNSL